MFSDTELSVDNLDPYMTEAFEQLVQIYSQALPESERKAVSELRTMLETPGYEFLIARIADSVVGFSIVFNFSRTNACLLEYMAVLSSKRGLGTGRHLFTKAAGTARTASRYMLLEVDSDKDQSAGRAIRTRRKKFYRELGCREVKGLSYIMPSVASTAPPAMDLLVYKCDLRADIERAQLRQWLECIYTEVYNRSADDVGIHDMLAAVPATVELV